MSFGDIAQSGFYGREYGGVYLDGVIVAVGYGYCLAFPFDACGGVHDCVGGWFKKVGGKHSFSSDNNKVILFLESDYNFFCCSQLSSYRDFEISPVIDILCGFF